MAEFAMPARITLHSQTEVARQTANAQTSKGQPWSEEEHIAFLVGLSQYGKGKWRAIAKSSLGGRKTPTQVASHAQKYFTRMAGKTKRASRFTSIEQNVHKRDAVLASSAAPPSGSASEVSCCSDSYSQDSQTQSQPCKPTARKPSEASQAHQACKSMLEALLQLRRTRQLDTAATVNLPSTQSAFTAAQPTVVAV